MIDRASRIAATPNDRPVRRQHLVSKVLLKRFASRDRDNLNLRAYDLDHGTSKLRPYASVGYVEDFVRFRSARAEKLWSQTENQLPAALKAVDDKTIFSHPSLVTALKETLVMHYFRAEQTRVAHHHAWTSGSQQTRAALLAQPEMLRSYARVRFGKAWDDAHDLGAIVDEILRHPTELHASEVLFQASLERLFDRGQQWAAPMQLEIGESTSRDFLLGDAPTVAYNAFQLLPRTALMDSATVALPISPRIVISLGIKQAWGPVDAAVINEINEAQIRQATRYVYAHPESNLEGFIRSARSRRGSTSPRPGGSAGESDGTAVPAAFRRAP